MKPIVGLMRRSILIWLKKGIGTLSPRRICGIVRSTEAKWPTNGVIMNRGPAKRFAPKEVTLA